MLRDRRSAIIAAVLAVTVAIWLSVFFFGQRVLTVTFLDVGEGLCAVVRTPSGKTMVVDCGTSSWRRGDEVGRKLVVPYLQSLGVDTIDVAVLSHPHEDHMSGYAGLLRSKPARLVLDLGSPDTSPSYKSFLKAVRKTRAVYRIAKRGQTLDLGSGVFATVLNPGPESRHSSLNNRSIALRLTYKNVAVLFTADDEEEAEQYMLRAGLPLRAQVLQVGHHGGANASSRSWLEAVKPRVAVISCGRHNDYGHPSRETLSRLEAIGARIYRTDRHGAVAINTDGSTVRVQTFRKY